MDHEARLSNYERSLVDEHNYGLKTLLGKPHEQPHIHLQKSFAITAYSVVIFALSVLAFTIPQRLVALACGVLAAVLVLGLVAEFYQACRQAAFLNRDPSVEKLRTFVRQIIQQDAGWREQWDWYNEHTGTRDCEPEKHDEAYLQEFIAMVHGGQLSDGGRLVPPKGLNPYKRRSVTVHTVWWPWWRLFMGVLAAVLGGLLGRYIWKELFNPYFEIDTLQVYGDVDPSSVSGDRVQDAGLVEFSAGVGLDRAKGGCFVNGRTYCVSPILKGGAVLKGLADATQTGSYDFFAVGIDCCSCPNQDFRCGEWNAPMAHGGIRSIDFKSRPFYRLAAEDWAADYDKPVKHAIFVEWVQNPRGTHAMWLSRGVNMILLTICIIATFYFMLAVILSSLLAYLVQADVIASPGTAQAAAEGNAHFWKAALPLWQGGEAAQAWNSRTEAQHKAWQGGEAAQAQPQSIRPQGPTRPILPPPTDPLLQGYGSIARETRPAAISQPSGRAQPIASAATGTSQLGAPVGTRGSVNDMGNHPAYGQPSQPSWVGRSGYVPTQI